MEIQFTKQEILDRILNEKNISITEEFINNIFKRFNFDHKVKNLKNYQTAMIHSSYLKNNVNDQKIIKLLKDVQPIESKLRKKCMQLQDNSYERLEYLGDSIIRHAIGKYLFLRYPNEDEGFLTTNRSKMERKQALSNIAKKLGLQHYVVISRQFEQLNGRTAFITLTEDVFEAFVGALNLEIDDNATVKFVQSVIEKESDIVEVIRTQNNYKDQLMRHFHKCNGEKQELQYIDTELEGADGNRVFKSIVINKSTQQQLGVGFGRSKKTSQQRSAKDAIDKLDIAGDESDNDEYFDENIDIATETKKIKKYINN